ncbi:GcrA family cell cycle regulator [Brucella rhizosphaerae]|uniref:GcrA family cell cycle regulator n=1 Tax=Brucella rhizosphaerae TaxID=571254 RepID=UPI0004672843|nr:GcrA family cell cycle regulator [Brucella rhizosphaerae]
MSRANYNLWTGERKQVVANLLREGKSAGQIATYMEISRSSVIGLVHRDADLKEIGFARSVIRPERKEPSAPKADRPKPQLKMVQKPEVEKPATVTEQKIASVAVASVEAQLRDYSVGLPLSALNWQQCRYAVNNAQIGEPHLFCGGKIKFGSSFCAHHHSRVFVRPSRKGAA